MLNIDIECVYDLSMWYIDMILCVYISFKNNKTQMILDIRYYYVKNILNILYIL